MGEILFFAISSDRDDPLALRTVADTLVRRRLLAVAGVSQVTPIGGAERQFQVIAHPDQLRANNIPVNELLERCAAQSEPPPGLHGGSAGVRAANHRSRSPPKKSARASWPCGVIGR
jgi:Cu/Ag efflux pump CusA